MAFSFSNLFSTIKKEAELPPSRVVGIDIGSSSVKVVELEITEKAPVLRTYGELQLGPYDNKSLGEPVKLELKKRTEVLVDVLRESGVQAKHGVLSMPLSSSFVTVIPVTVRKGEEIEQRIRIEARKYIPVPLTDVTLDWIILDPIDASQTSMQEVLLVAIQNESLNEFSMLLTSVGMPAQPSEIEIFSTIRAVSSNEPGAFGIIDLGARVSKLYIVRNDVLERIHRVANGGASITNKLASMHNLSFEDAENLKRSFNTTPAQKQDIKRCTTSVLNAPLQEFKRLIDQYEIRIGSSLSKIILTGGVALTPAIIPYMSDLLSREVILATPFNKVAYPAFMEDTINELGPSFSVSLGAALRFLN